MVRLLRFSLEKQGILKHFTREIAEEKLFPVIDKVYPFDKIEGRTSMLMQGIKKQHSHQTLRI